MTIMSNKDFEIRSTERKEHLPPVIKDRKDCFRRTTKRLQEGRQDLAPKEERLRNE